MEILIADTAMQIKSRYILTFVDVASPYYHDYIEKHTTLVMGCVIRDICGIVSEIKYPCLRMSVFALLNARRQSTAFGIYIQKIESSSRTIGNIPKNLS